MAVDRRDANLKMLNETKDVQDKMKESVLRTARQAAETEDIANQTLDELRKQGAQMDDIHADLVVHSQKLDETQKLQNTFDSWAGSWLGFGKRKAEKNAAAEIAGKVQEELMKVKEVFEQETKSMMSSTWKPHNMVLCSNTGVVAPELFVPSQQQAIPNSTWQVDMNMTGLDADGWTYSTSFANLDKTGAGDSKPVWNSAVRRRKWHHQEVGVSGNEALKEIRHRQTSRVGSKNAAPTQGEKIGYVPRQQQAGLKASGLSSAGMMGRRGGQEDQTLDDESARGLAEVQAADEEVDAGIANIGNTLDRLGGVASNMKEEVQSQTEKLEKIEGAAQTAAEKQEIVNQRLKKHLK